MSPALDPICCPAPDASGFGHLRLLALRVALVLSVAASNPALAQTPPTPAGPVLHLSAEASTEASNDMATAVLFVQRDGEQPGALQAEVNDVISSALAELKADSRLKVSTGGYTTYQRTDRNGKPEGWRVRAELRVASEDMTALSKAIDKANARMSLSSIQFSLTRAARERLERSLMQEAAANFNTKARDAAKALGYAEVELIEVTYNQSGRSAPMPRAMMAARMEAASLPIEPSQSTVTVSFGGSVRLKR